MTATETMNTPTSLIRCRHCGDPFDGPERPCPSPLAGREPYKDSGRGGHRFDPPPPPEPMAAARWSEIRGFARGGDADLGALRAALSDLLVEYDRLEAERRRLQRCILEDANYKGEPVFTREQIDRIMQPSTEQT